MATITFIVGLSGSGKTHLANQMLIERPQLKCFDEGFNHQFDRALFDRNYQSLLASIRSDIDCIVIEIALCSEGHRNWLTEQLASDVPDAALIWKCFENNTTKANRNVLARTNKGDPEGHISINSRVSPLYTYPRDAEILPIVTITKQPIPTESANCSAL